MSAGKAAACTMILTVIVAANNMVVNGILKLFGGRRKAVIVLGCALSLAGAGAGLYTLNGHINVGVFIAAVVCTAFPAGFFAIFGTVGKELNPPQYVGMAVAFVNFMAFIFISFYQNVTGAILKAFAPENGTLTFPLAAYVAVYVFFVIGAVISFIAAWLIPETGGQQR